jgi:hypothetical protein
VNSLGKVDGMIGIKRLAGLALMVAAMAALPGCSDAEASKSENTRPIKSQESPSPAAVGQRR